MAFMADPSMAIMLDLDNDVKMSDLKQIFIDKLRAEKD